jgi:hypothetical protein
MEKKRMRDVARTRDLKVPNAAKMMMKAKKRKNRMTTEMLKIMLGKESVDEQ